MQRELECKCRSKTEPVAVVPGADLSYGSRLRSLSGLVLTILRMSSAGRPKSRRQAMNSRRPSTGAGNVYAPKSVARMQ